MKKFAPIYNKITVITAFILLACILTASANTKLFKNAENTAVKPFYAVLGNVSPTESPNEKEGEIESSESIALTQTPEDILQLIEAAKENEKSETEDGKISEREYTGSGTNAKIGNIWVRNNTTTQQNINLLKYYEAKPSIQISDKSKPAVLIFHTHTTESYEMLDRGWYAQGYITRSNSSDRNMVRIGMEIKEELERQGYTVIHDTQIHDTKYTGAYSHSRESVEKILEENPSIQIVLDIHRDAIELDNGERIKPTATVLGKKAAQMMIITGCEEGKVTDFPNWEKNLSFALALQSTVEESFPGLMRPIYFCQRKYNMDLTENNLLIEVGSCANTLEEAAYSGRLLGNAIATLLDSQKKE